MEEFLEHFKEHTRSEQRWVCDVFEGVRQRLYPIISSSPGLSVEQLTLSVLSKVQRVQGSEVASLPVSYRFVSLSELTRQQRTPCCSSLTWSSAHYREQAKGVEQALQRENILLIGYLSDGPAVGTSDGGWWVRDAGCAVPCQMLKSSPLWLGRLMLFPTWNYIPQNAPARGGYLEIIDPPVCVTPEAMTFDPGGSLTEAMNVKRANELLRQRCDVQVCVSGQVSMISPLLLISGRRFFCLNLSEGSSSVPVLIMEGKHQYWQHCVCVGQYICITAMRVCSLRGWEGQCVLSVTAQSRLHPHAQPQENSEDSETHVMDTDSHTPDTHITPHTSSGTVTSVRQKHSSVISYKGLITKVLHAEAGLYEIDGKVGLCLAYQPAQKCGGGLRTGAEIQLHNIHFLYRPSPFSSDVVLCACLRSSVRVTAFSPLRSQVEVSQKRLQHHLLEKNLSVSKYLWLCYCLRVITERLCPRWVREERVCAVAGRLLDCVCDAEQKTNRKRDIYREMLEEPHQCPLTTYCVLWPCVVLWSVRKLFDWMSSEVWTSLSLSCAVPTSAAHMTCLELNACVSWSAHSVCLTSAHSQPLMVVGVLELSSTHATLQIRDQTKTLDCVCVENDQLGVNTAWLGCLVCVQHCTLVMERFMKTKFPSWKHLDQPNYITHKRCRLYVQFCVKDLIIISPSPAMSIISVVDKTDQTHRREHRCDDGPACVSLIFRLNSKQGVIFRNTSASADTHALQLGFTISVTCLGDVQIWKNDPKNRRVLDREVDGQNTMMDLHFVDACVRWFPVLHPGSVYRLIALNTEDVSALKAKSLSARGGVKVLSNPTLQIKHQWRIHALTQTEQLANTQSDVPEVISVSEVLHSRSTYEIVSFYGVISERITLQEETGTKANVQSVTAPKDLSLMEEGLKIRLTVQDSKCSGHIVQVYVDLSCGPYTPGLLQGATVILHNFQRKVSKAGNVYCRSLPISCVTVTGLGSVSSGSRGSQSPPPMVLLGEWVSGRTQQCIVGQVKGHVVCVLSLKLQWTCSLCGSIFRQGSCRRGQPPCDSNSGVFQAEAKVVVEDGSGEANVWFSSDTVPELLMLDTGQWEGLQRHIRVKGHVRVYTRGHNMMCDVDPEDPLVQYLCCLCSTNTVCRQIKLTCRLRAQRTGKCQLRKVCRGPTEFITKFPPAPQLHCLQIHNDTH